MLIRRREIIYSLRSCFRIEEANYDGSCRRVITAFYYHPPRYLMFYNNKIFWGNNIFHQSFRFWRPRFSYIWQTNTTFGDTEWFQFTGDRIVDSGIITEGRNCNLERTFSTRGQVTQK